MITLITMGQGNVLVLKETLESFKNVVDEVIYGDLLLFEDDREILHTYMEEYNLKIVKMPFNTLFKYGFSHVLNILSSYSSNDMVIYMNTSEVIENDFGILEKIKNNQHCNAFCFNHNSENHLWYRCYNKLQIEWDGILHEEVSKEAIKFEEPIFMMKDLEKDLQDPFKSKVFNDCKELVYFNNYLKLIDQPHLMGNTNPGWINFAQDSYHSFIERLHSKGKRYDAFITGDFDMYMEDIMTNPEFEKERFETSNLIEFQGDKKYLL